MEQNRLNWRLLGHKPERYQVQPCVNVAIRQGCTVERMRSQSV
ncbi:MAG: hypothetical protein AAF282_08230 [Cyanobacteria bacterium P01_A01_bin.15]